MPLVDFHDDCADAVVSVITAGLAALSPAITNIAVEKQPKPKTERVNLPAIIVTPGLEYEAGGGTNIRRDIAYPLLVGLYTVDPAEDPPGMTTTQFPELVWGWFHMQRLSGVATVMWCVVSGDPPLVNDDVPAFQQLRTSLTVTPIARRIPGT